MRGLGFRVDELGKDSTMVLAAEHSWLWLWVLGGGIVGNETGLNATENRSLLYGKLSRNRVRALASHTNNSKL